MTEKKPEPAFAKNDRVAWSQMYSVQHAKGSIVGASVVGALAPDAKLGTVVKVVNEPGTYFEVKLDDAKKGDTNPVLTADELVKVVDDE